VQRVGCVRVNASVSVSAHADMEKPVATLSERLGGGGEGMLAAREENDRPTKSRI